MNRRALIVTLLIIGAIMGPVAVYLWVFGASISSNHTRWSEFGSAMGGIYSPLVALLTLAVLVRQVALQRQMNVHEADHAYLQQARQDIEFYSAQIAQVMVGTALPGKTLRAVLHESFSRPSAGDLDAQPMRQLAADIHELVPSALDMWAAVYPILMGLDAGKTRMYDMTLGSSMQKLVALLSFETCVALDNFHRIRTGGRAEIKYVFSPLLREK